MTDVPLSAEKSTIPMHTATIYPTTSPNRTESCFQYDFANIWTSRQHASVTTPMESFSCICGSVVQYIHDFLSHFSNFFSII